MNTIRFTNNRPANLRSAVLQFQPFLAQKESNLKKIAKLIELAAEKKAKLIVLPEMCTSGYSFNSRGEIAKQVEESEGKSFKMFSKLAKKHKLYIVYGYPEISKGFFYNSQNLISPDGKLLSVYRKQNLFELDRSWADAGNSGYINVATDIGIIGLGICMDINFDSFLKFHRQHRTQIVAISSCWLLGTEKALKYWQFRWLKFKGLVMIANTYGCNRGSVFAGSSCIIENGNIVSFCPEDKEKVMINDNLLKNPLVST